MTGSGPLTKQGTGLFMHEFYLFLIGALAVWRITHLLHAEDGPFDLVAHLRRSVGAGFWGSVLDCFYCLSLWIAAPFAYMLGNEWTSRLLLWPALSGAAMLLQKMTWREPPVYVEDPPKTSGENR